MDAHEWLNLLLRWSHFIAGIAWIGSSFYFVWLDQHLAPPQRPSEGVTGEIWMVHSGGFYQVHRRKLGPGEMPAALHWFKWEAAITWMTGILLLAVVYYWSRGLYLVDPTRSQLSPAMAAIVGLAAIALSWIVYDGLWRSPLGSRTGVATALSLLWLAAVTYLLCRLLSGRAAFIHVGSLLGTIMVANVWMRILPAQQQMIDATKAGHAADYALGEAAKRRSLHNSYITFPVLLLMLSNHFPAIYGHPLNWLLLVLLIVVGVAARTLMIGGRRARALALVPAAASLVAVVALTVPRRADTERSRPDASGERVPFARVETIVTARCLTCHSSKPAIPTFGPSPGGVSFERAEDVRRYAGRIRVRAVETRTMPLGNMTSMTEEERRILGRWIDQGALTD